MKKYLNSVKKTIKRKKNRKWLAVALSIYLLGLFYLVLPGPAFPELPEAYRSTEPGDTAEIENLWAFYTNWSREETISFFKKAFSKSSFLGLPLPGYKLNHPPEYARETIRDTLQSNFYEELVHPWRESLFINGWVPSQDTLYKRGNKEPIEDFVRGGQVYQGKVTLYYVQSSVWARILVWTGMIVAGTILFLVLKSILLSSWWLKR